MKIEIERCEYLELKVGDGKYSGSFANQHSFIAFWNKSIDDVIQIVVESYLESTYIPIEKLHWYDSRRIIEKDVFERAVLDKKYRETITTAIVASELENATL